MSQPPRGASVRAVVIALACVAVFAWITPYNDYDLQNTYIAGNLFPIGAMVALLVLVLLVNPFLHRIAPRFVFRPAELGLVWCVIAIASGIPAAGLWRYCIPAATSLRYYATAENHWNDLMTPRLEPFLAPAGEAASQSFYEGSAGGAIPWHAWRAPLIMWTVAAALVFYACACLTVLLRRQWVERERFSFPLTQLPMELAAAAEEGHALNRFLRTPTVWAGAAIPLLVHGINGLHLYFPGVPRVDLHHNVGQYLPNTFPWWSIRWGLLFHIFPMTIGFAYLLSQEIGFSMAFFRIFELLQRVFLVWSNALGTGNDLQRFGGHEAYGAVLALSIMAVLLARPHLREVWAKVRGRGGPEDGEEALRYRTALVGLAVALLGIYATFRQFGMTPGLCLVVIPVGMAMYVAAAWGATNAGLMMVQMAFRPSDLLVSAVGSRALQPASLVNGALVENVFWFDIRETLMPSLMNAVKLAEETGLRQRSAFRVGAVALALAAGLSAWAWLELSYRRGGTQLAPGTYLWHAMRVWRECLARLDPGERVSTSNLTGTAVGAGLFFGLMALRLRFVWWPLHPIGLVTMYSWTSNQFGFSFLIGWAIKGLVVRLGGLKLYTKLRPFFLGMILGDVIAAAVMTAVGFVYGLGYFVTPD